MNWQTATDPELVKAAKEGADAAYNEIVRRYQQRVYWTARRVVTNHDDADEVAQETFVKAYFALKDFREESALFTWLYRIAMNESLGILRKRKFRIVEDISEMIMPIRSHDASPQEVMEKQESESLIAAATKILPEKQRMVFIMRYYDEMPYEEMSKVLKKSVGGLKANYFHAVRKVAVFVRKQHAIKTPSKSVNEAEFEFSMAKANVIV